MSENNISLHKLSLIFLLVGLMFFLQCSKKQEDNREGRQNKSKFQIVQKPFKIMPGSGNWPSFRGEYASGLADEQYLPDTWNTKNGEHILWKVRIPGLAHSSPVIWDDQIFVTTAISSQENASFREGLYGDGDASDDLSIHEWKLYCLNKKTGEILWDRLVKKGIPIDKRHIKATYANSTPATDGKYIITLFGSEGLFAYDVDGKFMWKKDLGRIDCGAYDVPDLE